MKNTIYTILELLFHGEIEKRDAKIILSSILDDQGEITIQIDSYIFLLSDLISGLSNSSFYSHLMDLTQQIIIEEINFKVKTT